MYDTSLLPPLSPSDARYVDQACDRYEAAWKAGPRPSLEECVDVIAEPARSVLLRQLLLLDREYRRRAGDSSCADNYSTRFPDDSALVAEIDREMAEVSVNTRLAENGSDIIQQTPWVVGNLIPNAIFAEFRARMLVRPG